LRLKDGETQILAGLISSDEQRNAAKVPVLGQIPVLGRLFSDHNDNAKKSEIVLSITPRIVGTPHVPVAGEVEYWSGTESSLRSELLTLNSVGTIAMNGVNTGPAQVQAISPPSVGAKPVLAPAQPMQLFWQGPAQAKVGEKISIALNAQANQPIGGVGIVIAYDPKVLRATGVVDGGFFKAANPDAVLKSTIDADGGQIQFDVPALGANGATGSGGMARLEFEVVGASAASQISVGSAAPRGPGGDVLAVTTPQPHSLTVAP
jgi:general secretion pathway protein D